MSIVMRILQQYDIRQEKRWMALEKQFAALEKKRPDFPKGRRLKPIAGPYPCNTLIWECEFPSLDEAVSRVGFLCGRPSARGIVEETVAIV